MTARTSTCSTPRRLCPMCTNCGAGGCTWRRSWTARPPCWSCDGANVAVGQTSHAPRSVEIECGPSRGPNGFSAEGSFVSRRAFNQAVAPKPRRSHDPAGVPLDQPYQKDHRTVLPAKTASFDGCHYRRSAAVAVGRRWQATPAARQRRSIILRKVLEQG